MAIAVCLAMSLSSCNNKTEEKVVTPHENTVQNPTVEEPSEIVEGVIRKSGVEWRLIKRQKRLL